MEDINALIKEFKKITGFAKRDAESQYKMCINEGNFYNDLDERKTSLYSKNKNILHESQNIFKDENRNDISMCAKLSNFIVLHIKLNGSNFNLNDDTFVCDFISFALRNRVDLDFLNTKLNPSDRMKAHGNILLNRSIKIMAAFEVLKILNNLNENPEATEKPNSETVSGNEGKISSYTEEDVFNFWKEQKNNIFKTITHEQFLSYVNNKKFNFGYKFMKITNALKYTIFVISKIKDNQWGEETAMNTFGCNLNECRKRTHKELKEKFKNLIGKS